MTKNGADLTAEHQLEEELQGLSKVQESIRLLDPARLRGRVPSPDAAPLRSPEGTEEAEWANADFALRPLVDKIAYGMARGLVLALRELENHIAAETRKVGDAVDRRLSAFGVSLEDVSKFVTEQSRTNAVMQDQLQQLGMAAAESRESGARQIAALEQLRTETRDVSASLSARMDLSKITLEESDTRHSAELNALRAETSTVSDSISARIDLTVATLEESDARQAAELASLRNETKTFSEWTSDRIDGLYKEVGVQQEDIAAVKAALTAFSSRLDGLMERLDRQADTVRSMCSAYSQRETELEQLVEGLTRLRARPTPLPTKPL